VRARRVPAALAQPVDLGQDSIGGCHRAAPVVKDPSAHVIGRAPRRAAADDDVTDAGGAGQVHVQPADEAGGVAGGIEVEAEHAERHRRRRIVDGDELAPGSAVAYTG
jgi:hypothetical protein